MDQRIDPESNYVSEMFLRGINAFLQFALRGAANVIVSMCSMKKCEATRCKSRLKTSILIRHGEKFYTVGESSGADQSTGEEEMWENPTYAHEDHYQGNPEFYHEWRISGQCSTGWLNDEDNTVLQTFMMLNCETFAPYGRMFEEYMTLSVIDITQAAMQKAKDIKFADRCKEYSWLLNVRGLTPQKIAVIVIKHFLFLIHGYVDNQSMTGGHAQKLFPEESEKHDRRDQVTESSLLRVETHVVDDVSDYDIAPVNPPNDEYVSDGDVEADHLSFSLCFYSDLKMNSARVPGTTAAPLRMAPGATGPASNHSTSSSRSNSYPQKTLNAMLNSPARLAQPHLHPDKINGALWFGIDPCVNSFIRATWQAYYMGPWKSWRKNAKGKRGHVYGLGSAQYGEQAPSSSVPNGLAHNLELEMRVGGLETSLQSVRQDVSEVKQDFASTRDAINQLLQTLRPQRAPTEQTFAQPQAPTTQP
ncbi:hypothetical protein HID58_042706 [Brassica napus]|uniref:Uncharacterized protein n=1 Tax=Brassica napus TaxID=3708 RepID=A0ABQ8BFT9_BRANA|nr:hypothetical protein HID58_042706 [Brassica napus]